MPFCYLYTRHPTLQVPVKNCHQARHHGDREGDGETRAEAPEIAEIPAVRGVLDDADRASGYVLACVASPHSDCVIEVA